MTLTSVPNYTSMKVLCPAHFASLETMDADWTCGSTQFDDDPDSTVVTRTQKFPEILLG